MATNRMFRDRPTKASRLNCGLAPRAAAEEHLRIIDDEAALEVGVNLAYVEDGGDDRIDVILDHLRVWVDDVDPVLLHMLL